MTHRSADQAMYRWVTPLRGCVHASTAAWVLCAAALPSGAGAANVATLSYGAQDNVISADRAGLPVDPEALRTAAPEAAVRSQVGIRFVAQSAQLNVMARALPRATADAASGARAASGAGKGHAATPSGPLTPDERPLWKLLRAQRLAEFDAAVSGLTRRFPMWIPSVGLIQERARQQRELAIKAALAGDLPALRRLIAASPDEFGCEHIDRTWRAADLFAASGDSKSVFSLYQPIIPACKSDVNRLVTLQRAVRQLPVAQADALIETELQRGSRSAATERSFAWLRDGRALDASPAWAADSTRVARELTELTLTIRNSRDCAAATRAGWLEFAQHDYDAAAGWFQLAAAYATDASGPTAAAWQSDATLGLIQVRVAQGDVDAAGRLLNAPDIARDPRARDLRAQIALLRADDAYRRGQYVESLKQLDLALADGAPVSRVEAMRGWSLYALGRYASAAEVFDTLYRQCPDDDSAEGLALSTAALERHGHVAATAPAEPADARPLRAYTAALEAQRLYYQKQFIAAQVQWREASTGGADPQRIAHYLPADLTGIDAASITGGSGWSNHAGAKGEGRLTVFSPALYGEWFDAGRAYELRYRQLFLNTGTGNVNAKELQFKTTDTLHFDDGRILDLHAMLGATQGGAVPTTLQGEVGIGQQTTWGAWSAYGSATPVRDSLLSWRGMSGQFGGANQTWGGVTRTMAGGVARWQVAPRWSVSTGGDVEWLTGHDVSGNEGLGADLAASYDLGIAGFDYASVGPVIHYLGYRRNENFYVPGAGGYYSPQLSTSAGVALQVLSREGQSWQWSGNLEAGQNYTRQANGVCASAGTLQGGVNVSASCAGSDDRGPYAHLQLAVVRRLNARWQVGALADVNVTPGRDRQVAALAFARYFLSPRDAVFSRDLPHGVRDFHLAFDGSR